MLEEYGGRHLRPCFFRSPMPEAEDPVLPLFHGIGKGKQLHPFSPYRVADGVTDPRLIRIRQRCGGNGDTAYALVTRSDDTALMGIPHDPLSLLGECRKVVWIYRGGEEYLAGAFPCVKQRDGHPGFVGKVVSWGNNGSSPARQLVGSFTVIPCP